MTTFTDDEAQLEGVEIPHGPITPSAATSGRRVAEHGVLSAPGAA